jgi:hypothetical protein
MEKYHYTIQVGKCGIQLGHEYWKQISSESFINPNGTRLLEKKKYDYDIKEEIFEEISWKNNS